MPTPCSTPTTSTPITSTPLTSIQQNQIKFVKFINNFNNNSIINFKKEKDIRGEGRDGEKINLKKKISGEKAETEKKYIKKEDIGREGRDRGKINLKKKISEEKAEIEKK